MSRKDFKALFNALGIQQSTVRAIMVRFSMFSLGNTIVVGLLISDAKSIPRAQKNLIHEAIEEPRAA